ncbi:MAG TPA: peptidase S16 [Gammaproteobacteria bacterium]|nr:peptidase S16 [Gammaproteobacteria bacterium]
MSDTAKATRTIPLFPLNTVLFPEGPLPLRIFEPRYLDMVSDCLRHDTGIGIILIEEGSETGPTTQTHQVGTLCHISYWNRRSDGLLGVTMTGDQRFRVLRQEVCDRHWLVGEVEMLPNEPAQSLPEEFIPLAELLERIIGQLDPPFTTMKKRLQDACWVGARLTELLPLDLRRKQSLLELDNPLQRLAVLNESLHELEMG